jgi:hypothetical protein
MGAAHRAERRRSDAIGRHVIQPRSGRLWSPLELTELGCLGAVEQETG